MKRNVMLTPLALAVKGCGMNHKRKIVPIVLCTMFLLPMSARAETVGQQFRDIMAQIDKQCRKDKMGPYLDPTDPDYISKRPITDCDILKIKPADPLATEEGRFAYSIKLPPPHDKPKVAYRPGMSAEAYFKELCEKEAGEWIFKTVEGVEGVFQGRRNIRPPQAGDSLLMYQTRETSEIGSGSLEDVLVQPYHGRFNYMERLSEVTELEKPYVRYYRGVEVRGHYKVGTQKGGRPARVPYIVNREPTDTIKSRFAFTWRKVADKDMLENGIAGSETIIFDRMTNDVLAFRRLFYRYWPRPDSKHTRLANHDFCRPRFADAPSQFIQKVLVPVNPAE